MGEVVLAHRGVLFFDELSEFARPTLEALRQPLEDGRVAIVRARHSAVYPARFALIAATNPCPCGYLGDGERCRCNEADLARHRRRLSGPLLDRIDIAAALERPRGRAREAPGPSGLEPRAGSRASDARPRAPGGAPARGGGEHQCAPGRPDAAPPRRAERRRRPLLRAAQERGALSARGIARVLRVARTAADLEGSARTREQDVSLALSLRPQDGLSSRRAA